MPHEPALAGSFTVDITPPAGVPVGCWGLRRALAEGAHDPLEVSAIVVEVDGAAIALVGVDVCIVDAVAVGEARRRIERLTGIPGSSVLINASHSHAAPPPIYGVRETTIGSDAREQWLLELPARIAGAVYSAWRGRRPARIGLGAGRAPGVTVNRVDRTLPVEETVWVMRLDSDQGTPLAVAVAFACHPVIVGGQTRLWDPDYPGPLRELLRSHLEINDVVFLQGASGDVAPFDFWFGNPEPRPHSFACRDDLARAVADVAIGVAGGIEARPAVRIAVNSASLELPRRRLPWSAAEVAECAQLIRSAPEPEVPLDWDPSIHTTTSAQRSPLYYQRSALALYERLVAEQHLPVVAELQAIQLGEHVLISSPFEPFGAVAAAIREGSPFPETTVLGFSNGHAAYLPAPTEYRKIDGVGLEELLDQRRWRWAYGITTALVGPDASAEVIDGSVRLLNQLG